MKKTMVLTLLAMLAMTQAVAQSNEYVPFVREGVKWVYYTVADDAVGSTRYHALELKGDTVLGGKTYKVMRKYSGSVIFHDDGVVPVCLREEGRVVYAIVPGGNTYDDCPVGIEGDTEMMEAIASGQEFVLYDFNNPVPFLESHSNFPDGLKGKVIPDRTVVDGRTANRFLSHFSFYDFCMVEGIGYDGVLYSYPLAILKTDSPYSFNLSHVVKDGEIIYRSQHYMQRSTLEAAMPLMQEGVKWVNEHVIIDRGEITRSLYTYEFQGVNPLGYAVCYRYEGESIEDSGASVAAYVKEDGAPNLAGENLWGDRAVRTMQNEPFRRTVEEGRNMIGVNLETMADYPTELYWFGGDFTDIGLMSIPNYYIRTQNGSNMNRENLIEVEPLTIGEYICRRYAYLGEDGQPRAYVIEGIGFDSRDMGDLLTPFTLPPDPNEDYQEYWGLSHVIKDGEIIYKGMRYKESALIGDVNHDGNVNMDDLSELINILLTNTNMTISSDVNGDNRIGMDDLSELINILLTQ